MLSRRTFLIGGCAALAACEMNIRVNPEAPPGVRGTYLAYPQNVNRVAAVVLEDFGQLGEKCVGICGPAEDIRIENIPGSTDAVEAYQALRQGKAQEKDIALLRECTKAPFRGRDELIKEVSEFLNAPDKHPAKDYFFDVLENAVDNQFRFGAGTTANLEGLIDVAHVHPVHHENMGLSPEDTNAKINAFAYRDGKLFYLAHGKDHAEYHAYEIPDKALVFKLDLAAAHLYAREDMLIQKGDEMWRIGTMEDAVEHLRRALKHGSEQLQKEHHDEIVQTAEYIIDRMHHRLKYMEHHGHAPLGSTVEPLTTLQSMIKDNKITIPPRPDRDAYLARILTQDSDPKAQPENRPVARATQRDYVLDPWTAGLIGASGGATLMALGLGIASLFRRKPQQAAQRATAAQPPAPSSRPSSPPTSS
jgi:hypothetical protein